MNTDEFGGVVRAVATAAVGYAAGKGLIPVGADTAAIVTAIVTVAVACWSVLNKRKTA